MRRMLSSGILRFGHTLQEHQEMIENPDRWPAWPVLPLKRSGSLLHMPETGFLFDRLVTEDGGLVFPVTLYHGNVCLLGGEGHVEYVKSCSQETFENAEAIIAAGWGVD